MSDYIHCLGCKYYEDYEETRQLKPNNRRFGYEQCTHPYWFACLHSELYWPKESEEKESNGSQIVSD